MRVDGAVGFPRAFPTRLSRRSLGFSFTGIPMAKLFIRKPERKPKELCVYIRDSDGIAYYFDVQEVYRRISRFITNEIFWK